ncbi:MAG: transposase [Oligoflexales bacterium]
MSYKGNCLSDKKQIENQNKIINRNQYEDYINRAKNHSKTKEFKIYGHERFWKMEGLFAEAKKNHCLRRAKYRGIEKV